MIPRALFSSLGELLTSGGDDRIALNPLTGLNKYGCSPAPVPEQLSYGSSTASGISPRAFAAASKLYKQLRRSLQEGKPETVYANALNQVRAEMKQLYGLERLQNRDIIFAASGTDLHLLTSQLVRKPQARSLLTLVSDAEETGSGVYAALHARHFSSRTAFSPFVTKGMPVDEPGSDEFVIARSREADGSPRLLAAIDAEITALAEKAIAHHQPVLLTLLDVSKTGLITPSPACAAALKRRFSSMVEILVDACQFRMSPATLQRYLQEDFIVAITGSKFVTGPAFSAALLVPEAAASRLRARKLPAAFAAYSARADWPEGWAAAKALDENVNFGLLLRWEAALAEMRAFRTLSDTDITAFLTEFSSAIRDRLTSDPFFELLPAHPLNRAPVAASGAWDGIQTIFPFLLRRPDSTYFTRGETMHIYESLKKNYYHLGQPVNCGMREGREISALRLCSDMRLVVSAVSPGGKGARAVISDALRLLDAITMLVKR